MDHWFFSQPLYIQALAVVAFLFGAPWVLVGAIKYVFTPFFIYLEWVAEKLKLWDI